jgi:hypothetical protein
MSAESGDLTAGAFETTVPYSESALITFGSINLLPEQKNFRGRILLP